ATIDGQNLPIVLHLMCFDRGVTAPNGHWSLTVHLNAQDIYKGVNDHDGEHENCLRCAHPSIDEEVTDDYKTPGDTERAVLPAVLKFLSSFRLKYKPRLHCYFVKRPRRLGKEKWVGNFVQQKWSCECPIHGKFTYVVDEAGGA